jgi:hypothetical protein
VLGAKRPALVKCSYCKEGDNIDEVDDVKQTQKEPNNIKKSQKQKNAEEVDRLCAIDSSNDVIMMTGLVACSKGSIPQPGVDDNQGPQTAAICCATCAT